jgi:caa(3)-type oxidase subunit IV
MANNNHSHHITPIPVFIKTLVGLLILTVVTVGVSYIDMGKANIFISLGVATCKAALVLSFFMGLKYDTNLNRVVIMSSFVALAVFLWLSASDLWTRPHPHPVKVMAAGGPLSVDDFKKLEASTDLASKGKEIFNTNCTVCHGVEGHGDGVAGAALNPKPRNFTAPASVWKNGPSARAIYVTLRYGIPGSGMAPYNTMSPADRWALVHYVRSIVVDKNGASPGEAKFAQAMKDDGIGAPSTGGGSKNSVPIDFAIDRMTR